MTTDELKAMVNRVFARDARRKLEAAADDTEPADSSWAEEMGFHWSSDGTAMVLIDGGWEVVLSGDVAVCEKPRGLALWAPACNIAGTKCQAARVLLDDPARKDVRDLCRALGIDLPSGHRTAGG